MYKIKDIPHLLQVYNDFLDAGTFDDPRNIEIKVKIEEALRKNDPELGEQVVNQYLDYYFNALMVKNQFARKEKEKPFEPGLYGDELAAVQQGGTIFCHVNQNQDWLYLTHKDLTKGLFINGPQGTGKTYPVLMYANEILKIPPSERDFNIIFIQIKKREADYFALSYPWVKILEWDHLWYNIWQVQNWETPRERIRSALEIFKAENFMFSLSSPPMTYAVNKTYRQNGVFDGSDNIPTYREIMNNLKGYSEDFPTKGFKVDDAIARSASTLASFIQEGDNINCKFGLSIEFFRTHDLVLNFMDVNEFAARTIIMCILHDLQRNLKKFPGKVLVDIDEARRLYSVKRDAMDIGANQAVEDWFTTCRDSGLARITSSQETNSVSGFVISNSAIRMSLPPIGEESTRAVAGLHNLNEEQIAYIPKMAPFGEAIMTYPGVPRPFLVKIPALLNLNMSVNTDTIYEMQKPWRDNIRKTLQEMQPRQKTPEEIEAKRYEAHLEETRTKLYPHTKTVLGALWTEPYLTKTQLKQTAKGTQKQFEKSIEILQRFSLIETVNIALKTKSADYFPLTKKAHDLLESTPEDRKRCPMPKYFEHRMACDKIAEHLESFSLEPEREFTIKGLKPIKATIKGKPVSFKCRIDVAANTKQAGKDHWLAIEVMFTDLPYMEVTLEKCMNKMMMDELIIITKTAGERDKARKTVKLTEKLTEGQKARVTCMSVKEFFTKYNPTA